MRLIIVLIGFVLCTTVSAQDTLKNFYRNGSIAAMQVSKFKNQTFTEPYEQNMLVFDISGKIVFRKKLISQGKKQSIVKLKFFANGGVKKIAVYESQEDGSFKLFATHTLDTLGKILRTHKSSATEYDKTPLYEQETIRCAIPVAMQAIIHNKTSYKIRLQLSFLHGNRPGWPIDTLLNANDSIISPPYVSAEIFTNPASIYQLRAAKFSNEILEILPLNQIFFKDELLGSQNKNFIYHIYEVK